MVQQLKKTITIPEELFNKAVDRGERRGYATFSEVVREALRRWLRGD